MTAATSRRIATLTSTLVMLLVVMVATARSGVSVGDVISPSDLGDSSSRTYEVERDSESGHGAGATLMVQGRWYGWEHVLAFDSADECENIRDDLRTESEWRDLDKIFDGLATRIAGRATKCVLPGSD